MLAEYVKPDDVCLTLKDGALIDAHVNVEHAADGGLQCSLFTGMQLMLTVSTLHVSVSVCGVAIGPNRTALSGYDAIAGDQFIASYSAGVCSYCVAVNADGSAA